MFGYRRHELTQDILWSNKKEITLSLPKYCSVWFIIDLLQIILFVIFLHHLICGWTIQTSITNSISQRYQIIIVNMLKNWNRRYFSHYIIKFIDFIPIHYTINLDIVSFFMVFNNRYLTSIYLLTSLKNKNKNSKMQISCTEILNSALFKFPKIPSILQQTIPNSHHLAFLF